MPTNGTYRYTPCSYIQNQPCIMMNGFHTQQTFDSLLSVPSLLLAFTGGSPTVAANGTVSVSFNLVNGDNARYRCVIRRHTRPRMRIRVPCSEGTFTADLTPGRYNVLVACRALGVQGSRQSIHRVIFVSSVMD